MLVTPALKGVDMVLVSPAIKGVDMGCIYIFLFFVYGVLKKLNKAAKKFLFTGIKTISC